MNTAICNTEGRGNARSRRKDRKRVLVRSLGRALVLGLGALLSSGATTAQDETEPRAFALPLARDARTLAEKIEEHLAAERWSEAVQDLQRLLEEHRAEVLPDSYRASIREYSVHPSHPGAADWARAKLLALPSQPRTLYRDRYEPQARASFERARKRGDRRALAEVARRWPIAHSATKAWWTLGDLELERGNLESAVFAWQSALQLADPRSADRPEDWPAAWKVRREHVLALGGDAASLVSGQGNDGRTLPPSASPTYARGPVPESDAEPWFTELDLEPFNRRYVQMYRGALEPTVAGDRLLVNSTLRVFCLDPFTGDVLWQSDPPAGWDRISDNERAKLFEGINQDEVRIAAAAGGKIAVAALQLPYSVEDDESWQGIEIMTKLPQRRLFAFDLEGGRPLWNHAPRLEWLANVFEPVGNQVFAQRMRIAAPPIVFGSRVLVPCFDMQGRIDYHVACYELETGRLLWSTLIVSGQRATNMFGRARTEFASSPLVVAGRRVIAQTELGTVAALDVFTGELLWESLYEQIALPKTRAYNTLDRAVTWNVAAPKVVGNVVLATPLDARDLLAFDLEDGRVLWTENSRMLANTTRRDLDEDGRVVYDLLLGADEDTFYVAGDRVTAFTKAGGLRSRSSVKSRWTQPLRAHPRGRPLLCRDTLVVPLAGERVVLHRETGSELRLKSAPWDVTSNGSLFVEDGMLFHLTQQGIQGYFDWKALFERQRERQDAHPGDPEIALQTARLVGRRAETLYERGETFAALQYLGQARETLDPLFEATRVDGTSSGNSPGASDREHAGGPGRISRLVQEELHGLLRLEAKVFEVQNNRSAALKTLEEARALATTRSGLRDTLFQLERLLASSNRRDEHLRVLADLEQQCADLNAPLERNGALGSGFDREVPVRLWVRLRRAESERRAGNLEAALGDWHAVLAEEAETELSDQRTAGDVVRGHIQAAILRPQGVRAYEIFEARAEELLQRALDTADALLLQDVARLYPHSRAALAAAEARLAQAFDENDFEAVTSIVYGALASGARAADEERVPLLRLAYMLGRSGNREFERDLIGRLAAEAPEALAELDVYENRPLRELHEELAQEDLETRALAPRFDANLGFPTERPGPRTLLGTLEPSAPSAESAPVFWKVYLTLDRRQRALEAYSNERPTEPAWVHQVGRGIQPRVCALAAGRVVFGDDQTLMALDAAGTPVWSQAVGPGAVQSLAIESGVVVALVGSNNPDRVATFDVHSGLPLWEHNLGNGPWNGPLLGEGRAVFFRENHTPPRRARIVDLFRGRIATEDIDLEEDKNLAGRAWIADGNLCVPNFRASRNLAAGVRGYDLDDGRLSWAASFENDERLVHVARYRNETFLISGESDVSAQGSVYRLDTEFGVRDPIVPLRTAEQFLGLTDQRVTELESPYLFTYSDAPSQDRLLLRAIHLPYQIRWTNTLSVPREELYLNRDGLPLPVVSEDCVALAFVMRGPGRMAGDSFLYLFDMNTGNRLDKQQLSDAFGKSLPLELSGLGEALFVGTGGKGGRTHIYERIR